MFSFFKKKNKDGKETEAAAKGGTAEVKEEKLPDRDAWEERIKTAIRELTADHKNQVAFLMALTLFRQGDFEVPMTVILSEEDEKQLLNAKKGDQVTTEEEMRLRPDLLKTPSGELYFPAFTSKEETDADYRVRFSWMMMSGQQILEAAKANTQLAGIVVNAFSQPFRLTRQMIDVLLNHGTTEHTLEKGTVVTFSRMNRNAQGLKEAAEGILKTLPGVRKAFFVTMNNNGEKSFLLDIDGAVSDAKELFGRLNAEIQKAKPSLPVDYVMYPAMKEQLKACGMQPFYVKSGVSHKVYSVPMEDSRTFFISAYEDDDGFETSYSFDFEYADDYHYQISGDEALRLQMKLQYALKTTETRLVVLVHDYLGGTLKNPADADNALLKMFGEFGVKYQSFHY